MICRKLGAIVEKHSTSTSTAFAGENDAKLRSLSSLSGDQYGEMTVGSTKVVSLICIKIKSYIRGKSCSLNNSPFTW